MASKLRLPTVTLALAETLSHDLARLAVLDCLGHADFGDVVIYSDDFNKLSIPGARNIKVDNWPSKQACQEFVYGGLSQEIRTPHVLFIEWDSGIIDPEMWKSEFLEYDYIGSPWGYKNEHNVGNGGFSLRSKALLNYLDGHKHKVPINSPFADDLVCRKYRDVLELEGFCWASEPLAHDFAFERCRPSPKSRHFGFHGMFNWPIVFPPDELKMRMELASKSPYVRRCSMWQETMNLVPWLEVA